MCPCQSLQQLRSAPSCGNYLARLIFPSFQNSSYNITVNRQANSWKETIFHRIIDAFLHGPLATINFPPHNCCMSTCINFSTVASSISQHVCCFRLICMGLRDHRACYTGIICVIPVVEYVLLTAAGVNKTYP
jgi:hypothetical protein